MRRDELVAGAVGQDQDGTIVASDELGRLGGGAGGELVAAHVDVGRQRGDACGG
jgi:hypothetical protein